MENDASDKRSIIDIFLQNHETVIYKFYFDKINKK